MSDETASADRPASRLRSVLRALDRYRWVFYLLLVAVIVLLPLRGYLAKTEGRRTAPPLPAEWTSSFGGRWDFSGSLDGHAVAYRQMITEPEGGSLLSFLGTFYGEYDPWGGSLGLSTVLQKSGNENLLLWAARHETGHALLDDIVARESGGGVAGYLKSVSTIQLTKFIGRNSGGFLVPLLPQALQSVYHAYIVSKPLGSGDDTDNTMNEFFAESYANLLTGLPADPNLLPVFEKYATVHPPH